jgi:hypothetical protein
LVSETINDTRKFLGSWGPMQCTLAKKCAHCFGHVSWLQ